MKFIENIGKVLIKLFSNLGKFILFIIFFFSNIYLNQNSILKIILNTL